MHDNDGLDYVIALNFHVSIYTALIKNLQTLTLYKPYPILSFIKNFCNYK